ncbi:MAG: ribosome biogenesis GTPase Der [Thermoanaerobaculia bacterium]
MRGAGGGTLDSTDRESPAATTMVAIVGRPNVGKSTLFNRLIGKRRAIVHDEPGVTRDRIVAASELAPGRAVQWVDTGGLVPGDDPLGLNEQVFLAVEESDLLVFLVDGREGLVPADQRVFAELARFHKPTIVAVNKADVVAARHGAGEFYRLGAGDPMLISAEHGEGVEALREAIALRLPVGPPPVAAVAAPAIAIVGRPNVGKSSLVNRLVGSQRTLVSPTPGTTRDPVDTLIEHQGRSFLLVDTAGIRRRSKVSGTPEDLAVLLARRQIERAAVAVLVIEAPAGVTSGDLGVAGAIWEIGRPAVVAINKWDLLDDEKRERFEREWPRLAEILAAAPRVNLSALSGRGVARIFAPIAAQLAAAAREIGTGELNRFFEGALRAHQPPVLKGRPWKLFYASQVSRNPPTFMLFANRLLPHQHPYRRYLENRLRETFGYAGVPLRLVIRRRESTPRHDRLDKPGGVA